jgi:carbon starvation protein
MNVSILLLVAIPIFFLAYRFYSKYIGRVFDEDVSQPTPACTLRDDVDFVPTKRGVLFGHHFASIAGGGPIIGPTVAAVFGYIPVFLWLVLGTVFIGAVHDFSALFVSLREKGKSIAEVARTSLGRAGFLLFISFTIVMLLMVTSAFLGLTSVALTSLRPIAQLGPDARNILKTVVVDGVEMGRIGGIASTSVIVVTCCAPFIGYLLYKRGIAVWLGATLAIAVCFVSIMIGLRFPVSVQPQTWMIILSIYTIFAAGIPVWIVLQPRDFTNSFILYIGIGLLSAGLIFCGVKGVKISAEHAFNVSEGVKHLGYVWPFLFITVACGAVSGFHALVTGGTTCKQMSSECDARFIAFGGMILESLLAVGVLLAIFSGLKFSDYMSIVYPTAAGMKSNPILAFSSGLGGVLEKGLGIHAVYGTIFGILLVEGFVVTTLDTAVRLNRYLIEELWSFVFKKVPALLKSYLVNALIAVALMFLLAYKNAYSVIWPVFGSANQLLAALTMIAISVWLVRRGKPFWFNLLPALFMMVTTIAALIFLLDKTYLPAKNYPLASAAVLLLLLSAGVIVLSVKVLFVKQKPAAAE